MNNKGWGMSTLIGFLVVFGIFLLIVTMLYNKNFSHMNDTEIDITEEESEENLVNDSEYIDLENLLKESAKEYITGKKLTDKYGTIITVAEIKKAGYLDDFIDVRNEITCHGYAIYNEDDIEPFIRCGKDYQTPDYDDSLE